MCIRDSASVDQRDTVLPVMTRLPSLVAFTDGQAYEDFDPSADAKAPYSLEKLLAGGGAQVDGLSALKRFAPLAFLLIVLAFIKLRAGRES